jgi:GT2 family glycosyltransferase
MFFSVIIPTCNRNDSLCKCLDSLAPDKQDISPILYEIIVTDDGSERNAENLVKECYPWVKWTRGPKKGPAANRNNGAKYAVNEWLIFIDDDCIPNIDLLTSYKAAINKNKNILAFEGSIIPDSWVLIKKDMAECPINLHGNCFWTANVCISKALFVLIEGFDQNFLIAAQEDQDIYRRLAKKTEIFFVKEAVVIHPVRFGSVSKKLKALNKNFANYLYYFKKHNDSSVKRHLISAFFGFTKRSALEILRLHFKQSFLNSVQAVYCFYLSLRCK